MIYCFLASGFEETEAVATVDTVRRGDLDVTTVGIGGRVVIGNHSIPVVADIADTDLGDLSDMTGIILPGGIPGTLNLEKSPLVMHCIDYAADNNLMISAICAAPSILGKRGLLAGKRATCFEGYEVFLDGAAVTGGRVEADGNIITGKAVGTAIEFGIEIIRYFSGDAKAEAIKRAMQCKE